MRNWRRRSRALYKQADRLHLNSDSDNFNPKTKYGKDRRNRNRRSDEQLKRWVYNELKTKDHYEDCDYHICKITHVDVEGDDIQGVSLIDGSQPRSCSLGSCGVVFFTAEEAERRATFYKEHGREKYFECYKELG